MRSRRRDSRVCYVILRDLRCMADMSLDEIKRQQEINTTLMELEIQLRNFRDAFMLKEALMANETTENRDQMQAFKSVAFRDAGMTLSHFMKILFHRLNSSLKDMPAYREQVDFTKFKRSKSLFSTSFPDTKNIRDAIAHAGELTAAKDQVTDGLDVGGSIKSNEGVGLFLQGVVENNTRFTSTKDGVAYSFDLSVSSVKALEEVFESTRQAFPMT